MNNRQLQKLVEELSLQYFKRPFTHTATFNNRLRTRGGDVTYQVIGNQRKVVVDSIQMHINPKLINLAAGDQELVGVIKHELAHYHLLLSKGAHRENDKDFRYLLRQLDAPKYSPIKPSYKTAYLYQCQGKEHHQILRNRKLDTKKYVCRFCRAKFELIEERHAA